MMSNSFFKLGAVSGELTLYKNYSVCSILVAFLSPSTILEYANLLVPVPLRHLKIVGCVQLGKLLLPCCVPEVNRPSSAILSWTGWRSSQKIPAGNDSHSY